MGRKGDFDRHSPLLDPLFEDFRDADGEVLGEVSVLPRGEDNIDCAPCGVKVHGVFIIDGETAFDATVVHEVVVGDDDFLDIERDEIEGRIFRSHGERCCKRSASRVARDLPLARLEECLAVLVF